MKCVSQFFRHSKYKAEPLHTSVELLGVLRFCRKSGRVTCDQKFIAAKLDTAFPAVSQHQQCLKVAAYLDVTPETVRRWLHGQSSPKLSDFMPVLMRCIEIRAESNTVDEVQNILWGPK